MLHVAIEFQELIAKIFEANGLEAISLPFEGRDFGYDLVLTIGDDRWAIEVKYYRTKRAQISLLEAAASKLVAGFQTIHVSKGMLIVSCAIDPSLRSSLEEKYGIVFVDRNDLFTWARNVPELLDRINALLESDETPASFIGRTIDEVLRGSLRSPVAPRIADSTGTNLCSELRSLKPGKPTWYAYEQLCERILRYLFADDLQGWHKQIRTDDGLNRFDYVCRIRPTTEFWQFLLYHLDSRYVLFEFKNYKARIRQGQVLTTEKYLLVKGLRRVAIIMSRSGSDIGAIAMMQGAMREHGKLILEISDDQVCEMLHKKENGDDPSDLLFDVADHFLMTLPR